MTTQGCLFDVSSLSGENYPFIEYIKLLVEIKQQIMLETQPIYLPQNIRFLRKKHQMSQEELAIKVGLNRGNIASYEKGTAEPKICNLLKLATVLGVSLRDLTEKNLSSIINGHGKYPLNGHAGMDYTALEKYLNKAEELQTVVSSLYNCHCFKIKNIEVDDKDTKVLVSNFEQLYEITHNLLHSHQELLKLVKNRPTVSNVTFGSNLSA